MDASQALIAEVERILEDPIFERAPVQSRLLRYLLDRHVSGDDRVTQHDIAIEGLGKSGEFDENVDSYVRVQVSRLRKSLLTHYATHAPIGPGFVYIKPGKYGLSLGSRDTAYPELAKNSGKESARTEPAGEQRFPEEPGKRLRTGSMRNRYFPITRAQLAIVFVIGCFVGGFLFWLGGNVLRAASGESPSASVQGEADPEAVGVPRIAYSVETVGFGARDEHLEQMRMIALAQVEDHLSKSIVAQPWAEGTEGAPEFVLSLRLDRSESGQGVAGLELRRSDGERIYDQDLALPEDPYRARSALGRELTAMTSPPGVISRALLAEIGETPKNELECFIMVELGRSRGRSVPELVDDCSGRYPVGRFTPYLAARKLFWSFQAEAVGTSRIASESTHWRELGKTLSSFPENPYLNTVAAKALYGAGKCTEAAPYQDKAFVRGRLYPALEMALLIEQLGCPISADEREEIERRIVLIVSTESRPHPLLGAYEALALVAIDRSDLLRTLPSEPFAGGRDDPFSSLMSQLREGAAVEPAGAFDRTMTSLVWNLRTRTMIRDNLARLES